MSYFIPGKIVKIFTTKRGENVVIRYPKWEDLTEMTEFINALSAEDTFLTLSGEIISKEGEMQYLAEMFKGMELGNTMYLSCFVNDKLIGSSTIIRDMVSRKRSYHVGVFGLTIAKDYRGEGLGEEIARTIINEAEIDMLGLRVITLNVYSPNLIAQNLYKKLGFIECGRIPQGIFYKGEYVDEIKMCLHYNK